MAEPKNDSPQDYPAERARQGEIILKSRRRRIVFVAGLVGLVILVLLVALFA